VALDPTKGELVSGGIAEQTTRALENLRAILTEAGADFSQVVKSTVFLVDMADFTAMNEVYGRAFGTHRPARSTVAVAALPRGAKVEIEVIAEVRGKK
jgi:2-iminobutanoate/2-iminopropanoate deaminase